jgi:hypothetical protein
LDIAERIESIQHGLVLGGATCEKLLESELSRAITYQSVLTCLLTGRSKEAPDHASAAYG